MQGYNWYKGSYEKIGKLIHLYCTNKGFDALNYFEIVLFSFLTGNNDIRVKYSINPPSTIPSHSFSAGLSAALRVRVRCF